MFQTTRTPVKVYRASDKGAPTLTNAAGSLKTLLKGCLTTGYGEGSHRKEPLGFAMPFEDNDNHIAVFHSTHEQSHHHCLRINNRNANYAQISPYTSVDSAGVGSGYFGSGSNTDTSNDNFAYNLAFAQQNWLLVGHERAFVLVLPDSNNKRSQILWFGDVPTLKAGDFGNTLYVNTSYNSATYYDNGTLSKQGANAPFLALNATGTNLYQNRVVASLMSTFFDNYNAYPDPITGGLCASEIYITEYGYVRCLMTGLLSCGNNLQALNEYTPLDLGDGDVWVKLNLGDGDDYPQSCFLLNLNAWEA